MNFVVGAAIAFLGSPFLMGGSPVGLGSVMLVVLIALWAMARLIH